MITPSGKPVNKNTPIYPGSNFTWGEATKNCTRQLENLYIDDKLIITAVEIEKNIVATAIRLDELRERLKSRPIWLNSWYRPAKINKSVGGAKYSRHQYGDAADIRSNYFTPNYIYQLLNIDHNDGGLHAYPSFVHIDWRGQLARW